MIMSLQLQARSSCGSESHLTIYVDKSSSAPMGKAVTIVGHAKIRGGFGWRSKLLLLAWVGMHFKCYVFRTVRCRARVSLALHLMYWRLFGKASANLSLITCFVLRCQLIPSQAFTWTTWRLPRRFVRLLI